MKLFLFPGLACTQRLFLFQKQALGDRIDVVVPSWIEPIPNETLEEFACRWAEKVYRTEFMSQPETNNEDCYIGGLSFGGMVAPIIGQYLQEHGVKIRGCFLFATIRGGTQIPSFSRFLWKLTCLLPNGGWNLVKVWAKFQLWIRGDKISIPAKEALNQFLESPSQRSHNVLKMICAWHSKPTEYSFPIWHLHGTADCLLPIRLVEPDQTVPGAGHLLTLTRPEIVNQFIRERVAIPNHVE